MTVYEQSTAKGNPSRPTEDMAEWAIEHHIDLAFYMGCEDRPPSLGNTRQCEHCRKDKLRTSFNVVNEVWGVRYAWWCKDCQADCGGMWGVDRYAFREKQRVGRKARRAG